MSRLAIELDGRLISLARAGRIIGAAPAESSQGAATQSLGPDLLRCLAGNEPAGGESVWIATSARYEAAELSAVLDVARGAGLAVAGFVDAAAVSVSALELDRNALVLEIGLHHVAVTAVEHGAQARRRRSVVSRRGGLFELGEAWLGLIGTAMVKRTRFDPLHNVATEQQLRAGLPGMIRELAGAASTAARVTVGGEQFEIALSRDQFVAAAEPVYREVSRQLHELRPAGAAVALIMPSATAALPGLRDAFQKFVGCELVELADGFAAAATSLLDLPGAADDQAVRLLRRLPSRAQPALATLVSREPLGGERATGPAASHILFDGKAHALAGALTIGRAASTGPSISLPEGSAGVSRRHCTLVGEGGELLLVDHSRFGTFLNGERVSERARVYAGDRIRIGDPGMELSLISLG